MKFLLLASGMTLMTAIAMAPAGAGETGDGHTTVVQDENGTAVITQSGDPAQAEVKVDKEPGRTTVYRRSGGNTAIVSQGTRKCAGHAGLAAQAAGSLTRAIPGTKFLNPGEIPGVLPHRVPC